MSNGNRFVQASQDPGNCSLFPLFTQIYRYQENYYPILPIEVQRNDVMEYLFENNFKTKNSDKHNFKLSLNFLGRPWKEIGNCLKANQTKNSIGPHFCTIDSPP